MNPYPIDKKFESFGFAVFKVDGHNFENLLVITFSITKKQGRWSTEDFLGQ